MELKLKATDPAEEPKLIGLHQHWIMGEDDVIEFELSCGAGVGNSFLQLVVTDTATGKKLYSNANIAGLVTDWVSILADKLAHERD
jgi:hypothetical protein